MRRTHAVAVALMLTAVTAVADTVPKGESGEQALKELLAGNQRYVAGKARPHHDDVRRLETATSQKPRAIVLSCADSRVPPELVLDQGLGDLFTIRVAGNVVNDDVMGSVEYAVEHLGARLIVVLGHERCGAVAAALAPGDPGGHVTGLVTAIRAGLTEVPAGEEKLDRCVRVNAAHWVTALKQDAALKDHFAHGLQIVAARYDLDTGVVEILK